ncbi:Uncharacterized protein TCM_044540 [Theobroma cacao]|uniref:Uncharacterized protein n=1 Tax=Theobroma cacao TaxID=3641 RepID=A0A061FR89_THECC|nr:Uncharacterized protein TCM_044540 [Theobroma cacao]
MTKSLQSTLPSEQYLYENVGVDVDLVMVSFWHLNVVLFGTMGSSKDPSDPSDLERWNGSRANQDEGS